MCSFCWYPKLYFFMMKQSWSYRRKYCGGSGSNTGTKNLTRCSSWQYLDLSKKYSWCKMTSESTSSTKIQKASEAPWIFSSHWKSGVMVNSTRSVDLRKWTISLPYVESSSASHAQCRSYHYHLWNSWHSGVQNTFNYNNY